MRELHVKHRPKIWDEVRGNRASVRSIRNALEDGRCRAFLFHGPPGTGKTTAARLVAVTLEVDPDDPAGGYVEHDAAVNSGIDDVREIVGRAGLSAFAGGANRVVVLDEAHMLSKPAWNALLKSVEEPPPGLHWVFCTTAREKVPVAIRNRCAEHGFAPLPDADVDALLADVAAAERMKVDPKVRELVVGAADGSARRALVLLGAVSGLSVEAAVEVLESGAAGADEPAEAVDLCRALAAGAGWSEVYKLGVAACAASSAETVRQVALAYFAKVAGNPRMRQQALAVLDGFARPYPDGVGQQSWPVVLSLGGIIGA